MIYTKILIKVYVISRCDFLKSNCVFWANLCIKIKKKNAYFESLSKKCKRKTLVIIKSSESQILQSKQKFWHLYINRWK